MSEFVLQETSGSAGDEFSLIPDGEILALEVINCEVRETPFDDATNPGTKQKEVSFRFKVIEEGEWYGRNVFGNTSTTFSDHPDCRLRMWVQELLGQDSLSKGFRFDTDTLIGLTCRGVIQLRTSTGADGSTKHRNRVQDVFRQSASRAEDIF